MFFFFSLPRPTPQGQSGQGVKLTTHPHLVPRLMHCSVPPLPQYVLMAWCKHITFSWCGTYLSAEITLSSHFSLCISLNSICSIILYLKWHLHYVSLPEFCLHFLCSPCMLFALSISACLWYFIFQAWIFFSSFLSQI
jgi:hypothetical protein